MNSEDILSALEATFGKIPSLITENMKYLCYRDDTDVFICSLCDKTIQIVHDNLDSTSLNFEKHLLSVAHQKLACTQKEVYTKLNITFKGKIPQIVKNNIMLLDINGCDYECSICKKIIKVTGNAATTETTFSYHLKSDGHEQELEDYRDYLGNLHDLYGAVPLVVLNHKQFLIKNGKHYTCKICDKQIMVHPTSVSETEKSFEKHLHSLKHMQKAKQENAFSLIPQLKNIFNPLPRHMLKNIEYVSVNGFNFFCLLCNENIKVSKENHYETQLNFKLHNLSATHEENLKNRQNSDNAAFQLIEEHFDGLPASVTDNLNFLSIDGDDYYCNICHSTILKDENSNYLSSHFESSYHLEEVNKEMQRQSDIINELENLFGCLPQVVEENIKHIEYRGDNRFECLLCEKTMIAKTNGEDYESNASTTEKNFASHLESVKHCEEINSLNEMDDELLKHLEEIFFPIPQFILNNLEHICYTDTDDNFSCFLCDKTIQVVSGNKKGELTEQNFRVHLLSAGHLAKLKHKANQIMETTQQLEAIFNHVPNFVMSNIEYIHTDLNGHFFSCTLCDAKIKKQTNASALEQVFRMHLLGKRHKSNLEGEEADIDEALERIDLSFIRIPEFILRNIDFLSTIDDNLFCELCQMNLPINTDDITTTTNYLRDHFKSSFHKNHFKSL